MIVRFCLGEKSAEEATNSSKDEIIVCALSPGRASLRPGIHKMAVLSWTAAHGVSARLKWSLKHLPTIKESLLLWAALGQAETSSPSEHFFHLPKCLTQSPSIALPAPLPPLNNGGRDFHGKIY